MESRVKDGNYYVVQSFMVKDLKLKGLEKDVYAIIYGFSQAGQKFDGSLQYLADWTMSTKQGIIKVLKSLQEKDLINKEEEYKNSVKFVKYYATEFNRSIKQDLMVGIKQSLLNNIDKNNIINNKEYIVVLDYLNEKVGSNFKPIETHLKLIKARMQDYTEQDLKNVIDKKVKEWKGTEMQQYLRPKTLFNATNFENYVNCLDKINNQQGNFIHNKYTKDKISSLISDLDNTEV